MLGGRAGDDGKGLSFLRLRRTFMERQKSMKADVRRQEIGRNHRRKVSRFMVVILSSFV